MDMVSCSLYTCLTRIEEHSLVQENTQDTVAAVAAALPDIDCILQEEAAGKEAIGFARCNVGVVDGEAEFEEAGEAVLQTFQQGGNAADTSTRIPDFSAESAETPWTTIQARLSAAVIEYVKSNITGAEAVYLAMPLWRTCFLPMAVLFEAWSRTTGLPTIFYIDAFSTLMSSLLRKDITYRVTNFPCRARYWAVGTAAPGEEVGSLAALVAAPSQRTSCQSPLTKGAAQFWARAGQFGFE